jgi:hypothetical protein
MDQIEKRWPVSAEREVIRALFFHGPLFDGDIPSKSGRDVLVERKLVRRQNGWNALTDRGFDECVAMGMGDAKERWDNARRGARTRQLEAIERAYGLLWNAKTDRDTFSGVAVSEARWLVLGLIDKEGQARGIEWANEEIRQQLAPVHIVEG